MWTLCEPYASWVLLAEYNSFAFYINTTAFSNSIHNFPTNFLFSIFHFGNLRNWLKWCQTSDSQQNRNPLPQSTTMSSTTPDNKQQKMPTYRTSFNGPFSEAHIEAWLTQFDAFLQINDIDKESDTAAALLIQAIPTRLLAQVTTNGGVQQMRQQLRLACGVSQEVALNSILGAPQETNEPPRSLVTKIKNAITTALPGADEATRNQLLISRYIASMSPRIRELLTVIADQTIEKLVELTEKLQASGLQVNTVQNGQGSSSTTSVPSNVELQEQLQQLTLAVNKLASHQQHYNQHQQPHSNQRHFRSRSPGPHNNRQHRHRSKSHFQVNPNDPRCYYHQRWGNKAIKCTCSGDPN